MRAQWIQTKGPHAGYVSAFAVSGTNLFAGTNNGLFLSTNNGTNWTATGLQDTLVSALGVNGTNLFVGTSGILGTSGGVFLLTNNGTNWIAVNACLPDTAVLALAVSGTNLFTGSGGGDVWRRPLSEMITSVERLSTGLPTHFRVAQNYPNPFNPSTKITYALPMQSNVILKVYDVLGREIATLVNEKKQAGEYRVEWNAPGYSSGVYFYRIVAGDLVQTRKMILTR